MIPEEYKPMIDKIISNTDTRKCSWETTSDSEKFILKAGANSISIFYYESYPDDVPVVALEILNLFGEKVDGIYIKNEDIDFDKMYQLYTAARRNALKITETISDIMTWLD